MAHLCPLLLVWSLDNSIQFSEIGLESVNSILPIPLILDMRIRRLEILQLLLVGIPITIYCLLILEPYIVRIDIAILGIWVSHSRLYPSCIADIMSNDDGWIQGCKVECGDDSIIVSDLETRLSLAYETTVILILASGTARIAKVYHHGTIVVVLVLRASDSMDLTLEAHIGNVDTEDRGLLT
jgi:hypothetical protein